MENSLYTLDDSPWFEWVRLASVDSTNNFLKHYRPVCPKEMTLVTAEFQTAGRGQAGHVWESEAGSNLLFSLKCHPRGVEAPRQFVLSQAIALAVCETLSGYAEGFSIKWPNDIYWHDRKVCGMLIENALQGKCIEECVVGVGLNVNQAEFRGDAPNPVSLRQITGMVHETVFILAGIVRRFKENFRAVGTGGEDGIARRYAERLYRRAGFHAYEDGGGIFEAEIRGVEPSGHLLLADREGRLRRYAFKEVRFRLPADGDGPALEV